MTAPAASRAAGVSAGAIETGAAAGAAGLALTSTGSMVVAAVLLGIATRSRWSAATLLLATAAVGIRFSTVTFDDLAGIQSVLGSAGIVGPAAAAASAWCAAAAVIVATRVDLERSNLQRCVVSLAGGAMAAAIAVGAGPGGALADRVAATALASVAAFALLTTDDRPRLAAVRRIVAVVVGIAAVVLAGWPS
ncbi:hypothetical protein [Actinospongicola halichondriae]|uniref:hypothetical protein n=1 Tax=Actinospongicola halichondriae TaxID=3236844 RepID=UPI003D575D7F